MRLVDIDNLEYNQAYINLTDENILTLSELLNQLNVQDEVVEAIPVT